MPLLSLSYAPYCLGSAQRPELSRLPLNKTVLLRLLQTDTMSEIATTPIDDVDGMAGEVTVEKVRACRGRQAGRQARLAIHGCFLLAPPRARSCALVAC